MKENRFDRQLLRCAAALLLALYLLCPPVRTAFHGSCMLFTQRSVHVLIGSLNGAACPALKGLWLAVFQCVVLPFLNPMLMAAEGAVLGTAAGIVCAAAGYLLGGLCCHALADALLGWALRRWLSERRREQLRAYAVFPLLLLGCCLPAYYPLCCYLAGALGLRRRSALALTVLTALPMAAAYVLLTGVYSTYLPDSGRLLLAGWGGLWAIAGAWRTRRAGQ